MQELTFVILYKLNKKTITEKYCINKKIENSSCHGACHLKTTLIHSEKNAKKNPYAVFEIKLKNINTISQNSTIQNVLTCADSKTDYLNRFSPFLPKGVFEKPVKPPIVLV